MRAGSLWDYAVRLYGQPGVEAACLRLQDEADADIPLVLYLLWCAATGRHLDAPGIASAAGSVAPWREGVVRPLREVRRAMKRGLLPGQDTEALRSSVKAAELAGERLALAALERDAPDPAADGAPDRASVARTHLALYRACLKRDPASDAIAALLAGFDAP